MRCPSPPGSPSIVAFSRGSPRPKSRAALRRLAADDRMTWRESNTPIPSPPSPLTTAIMGPIEQLAADQFPTSPSCR